MLICSLCCIKEETSRKNVQRCFYAWEDIQTRVHTHAKVQVSSVAYFSPAQQTVTGREGLRIEKWSWHTHAGFHTSLTSLHTVFCLDLVSLFYLTYTHTHKHTRSFCLYLACVNALRQRFTQTQRHETLGHTQRTYKQRTRSVRVLQCIMGVGVAIDLRPGAGNMKPCGRRRRRYCACVCVYREEVLSSRGDSDSLWGSEESSLILIQIQHASLKCTEQSLRTHKM